MTRSNNNDGSLEQVLSLMRTLRGESGCSWNRKQTLRSLRKYLLEETHELISSIDEVEQQNGPQKFSEELGDLLLQFCFLSVIAEEKGWFTPKDTIDALCEKLIRRHPHVFGEEDATSPEEVSRLWEKVKTKERQGGALQSVPTTGPALLAAQDMSSKAAATGFDWPDIQGVLQKITEELGEVMEVSQDGSLNSADRLRRSEEECGDLLFSVVNLCRKFGVSSELALRGCNERFRNRFSWMEHQAKQQDRSLSDFSLEEMETFWSESKQFYP